MVNMADTEKITMNINVVDLGQIDLLVARGYYSNRADLIRAAIRNQVAKHEEVIKQTITSEAFSVGIVGMGRKTLEALRAANKQLELKVVGMLVIADDVSPELADAVIKSIQVRGVLRASDAVKTKLADRIEA